MHSKSHSSLSLFLIVSTSALLTMLLLQPSQVLATPTPSEYGVVLNLAGRQRMLTQKMSKEVLLIALNVDAEDNLKNLVQTIQLFDRTQTGLRNGDASLGLPPTTNERIRKQLEKVEGLWKRFRPIVDGVIAERKVTAEAVKNLAAQNPLLLKETNKVVLLYEKDAARAGLQADPSLAVTINLAGKQRMLSQKMCKEYLLFAYGYETENNKLNLLESYGLFERTLQGLQTGDPSLDLLGTKNATILQQLAKVDTLWQALKPIVVFATEPSTTSIPPEKTAQLARINPDLLREMNIAVEMFEREAR